MLILVETHYYEIFVSNNYSCKDINAHKIRCSLYKEYLINYSEFQSKFTPNCMM